MRKVTRALEVTAKWASLLIGTLILGTCSVVGVSTGGTIGLFAGVLGGLVLALLLVGWVLAAARLNADVKAIRERLPQATAPVEAGGGAPLRSTSRALDA